MPTSPDVFTRHPEVLVTSIDARSLDSVSPADGSAGSLTDRRPIPPPPGRSSPPPVPPSASASAPGPEVDPCDVLITAWVDPLVDDDGHDPRSRYVEQFWLGVLGPTATWILRRLVAGLEQHPEGYRLDLSVTARMMGLSYTDGRSSPFAKALQRCTMFGLAHQTSAGLAVRRRVPSVAHRHLRRMPDAVQLAHREWEHSCITVDALSRAHRIALAMLESGDDLWVIEHQLVAVGIDDATAAEVADNARRL
ncbi:MAG: hypothetical protein ABJH68_22050 [Ilumatobacter sp.]|uniref:hypothetical protein n=1 Tax=Ilumatobacter sp. TaxID=1967498 RepID=UPI003296AF7A